MNSETIITVSIYLFIITSMLFIGLGHTWRDILAPFKNVKLVLFALLVNLILIPVAGYLIATVFALSGAMVVGFLLMTSAPGASYSPRIAEIAEGNVPFSTGLMFLLSTIALVSAPITILLLLPGGKYGQCLAGYPYAPPADVHPHGYRPSHPCQMAHGSGKADVTGSLDFLHYDPCCVRSVPFV